MGNTKNLQNSKNFPLSDNYFPISKEESITSLELEKLELQNEKASLNNRNLSTNINLKINIFKWVKWVVSIYLTVIGFILIALTYGEGKLEPSVIIALLTTTTINIIGLPALIINSLFPKPKFKKSVNEKIQN